MSDSPLDEGKDELDKFINQVCHERRKINWRSFSGIPYLWQHDIPKMTNRKSAQKFNAQNRDYLQKCRNLKNPKTAATIALSTAKPTNLVHTNDIQSFFLCPSILLMLVQFYPFLQRNKQILCFTSLQISNIAHFHSMD